MVIIRDLNGHELPQILHDTTNFNTTQYRELDMINSLLRGEVLTMSLGKSSDDMEFYSFRITGIGHTDREHGYYSDSKIIWGKWVKNRSIIDTPTLNDMTKEFIGYVSGINGPVGATFCLQLELAQ